MNNFINFIKFTKNEDDVIININHIVKITSTPIDYDENGTNSNSVNIFIYDINNNNTKYQLTNKEYDLLKRKLSVTPRETRIS